jgi:hypothetical protein
MIDGQYFAAGAINNFNNCLTCQPSAANNGWTPVPGCGVGAINTSVACTSTTYVIVDDVLGGDVPGCGHNTNPCQTLTYVLGRAAQTGSCYQIKVSGTPESGGINVKRGETYPLHISQNVAVLSEGVCFPGAAGRNVFNIDIPPALGTQGSASLSSDSTEYLEIGGCEPGDPRVAEALYASQPVSVVANMTHVTTGVHIDSGGAVAIEAAISDAIDGVICRSDLDPALSAQYNIFGYGSIGGVYNHAPRWEVSPSIRLPT